MTFKEKLLNGLVKKLDEATKTTEVRGIHTNESLKEITLTKDFVNSEVGDTTLSFKTSDIDEDFFTEPVETIDEAKPYHDRVKVSDHFRQVSGHRYQNLLVSTFSEVRYYNFKYTCGLTYNPNSLESGEENDTKFLKNARKRTPSGKVFVKDEIIWKETSPCACTFSYTDIASDDELEAEMDKISEASDNLAGYYLEKAIIAMKDLGDYTDEQLYTYELLLTNKKIYLEKFRKKLSAIFTNADEEEIDQRARNILTGILADMDVEALTPWKLEIGVDLSEVEKALKGGLDKGKVKSGTQFKISGKHVLSITRMLAGRRSVPVREEDLDAIEKQCALIADRVLVVFENAARKLLDLEPLIVPPLPNLSPTNKFVYEALKIDPVHAKVIKRELTQKMMDEFNDILDQSQAAALSGGMR